MKVLTAAQMAAFDRRCIDRLGVPGLLLMEHAGLCIAHVAREVFDGAATADGASIVVLCGGGNNGGDGFVAARHLLRWGYRVEVGCLKPSHELKGDCAENFAALEAVTGVAPQVLTEDSVEDFVSGHAVAIDALFGTGLSGPLRGSGRAAVEAINRSGIPVIAADIPSGFSADGAGPLGRAVRASCTVTMGLPKLGFFAVDAAPYLGELIVADIGFPRTELTAPVTGESHEVVLAGEAAGWCPLRRADAHKGQCGKVLVIGGSCGMVGAAAMAARSALRAGAGLVTLAVPEGLRAEAAAMVPEVMTMALPADDGHVAANACDQLAEGWPVVDAVLLGPGLGRTAAVTTFVGACLSRSQTPIVLDADALYHLEPSHSFQSRTAILTPHEGEAGRLCAVDAAMIAKERHRWVRRMALQRNATVVLKGPHTLSCSPHGRVFINPTGNAGMATAGAGDVLAGVTAALLAQMGDSPLLAAALGAYVHGLAGDVFAERWSSRTMTALDIIDSLTAAFSRLEAVTPADGCAYPETLAADGIRIVA